MRTRDDATWMERAQAHRLTWAPVWFAALVGLTGAAAWWFLADWPTAKVIGIAVLCALAPAAWLRTRLRRPWRRRHGYLVLVCSIIWVAMAHAEVAIRTLLLSLGVGMLLLGIPWWTDQMRRDKVRIEGELATWDEVAKRIKLTGTRWTNHVEIPGQGWRARFEWPPGMYDRDEIIKNKHRIEGARSLPVGSLRLMPHGRERNFVDALCIRDDPHTEAIEWPGPAKTENYRAQDPYPLGLNEEGEVVTVQRFRPGRGERRILIGGSSDSGKSGAINHFVGEDACREDIAAFNIDLKGGLELSAWSRVAVYTADTVEKAKDLLKGIEALITEHEEIMKEKGWRHWRASPSYPAVHINVDELRMLAGSSLGRTAREAREVIDRLIQIAQQGRAVGVGLLMAGQHLTLEAAGSSQVTTQFDIRLCFRMNTPDGEQFVMPGETVRAHEIPEDRPGTFYLKVGEKLDRRPVRNYYWTDELVAQIAQLRAGANAYLPPRVLAAMCAAAPLFAEYMAERDGQPADTGADTDSADTNEEEDTDMADIPEFAEVNGPDIPLSEVMARHAERTGKPVPAPAAEADTVRLSEEDARAAVWRMLVDRGEQGATAKELREAATRSASWLHELIAGWCDDPSMNISRTMHGRYAHTGSPQRQRSRSVIIQWTVNRPL